MNDEENQGDVLVLLQRWYSEQCDGDWEHSYGVRIDTLDNPGWILTVDLDETELSGLNIERVVVDRSDTDWVQYEASGGRFVACGGPFNLSELILQFLSVVNTEP